MKQLRAIVLTCVLILLGVVTLYACGDTAPTATPVPPPTATAAPPTAVPPSPTSQAAVKATDSEVAVIQEALANAKDLKSYHFTIDVQPSDFITQPVKAEGDYVAPNTAYVKGTMGGENIDEIIVGDKVFVKGADGKYTEKQKDSSNSSDPTQSFNPETITSSSNPIGGLGESFKSIKTFKNEGTTTIDGVKVTKYSFSLNVAEMMGDAAASSGMDLSGMDLGGGELWVDTSAKNLHKLQMNLNMGPLMELLVQAFSGMLGTPTPGGPQPTPFPKMAVNMAMTISKHNDPSIKIPLTDEMKKAAEAAAQPTATEEPFVLDTPVADSTPEEGATPEEASTPEAFPTFPDLGISGEKKVVEGSIGQTITLNDVNFTVNKVERTTQGNLAPGSGNEYVVLTVTVENKTKADLTLSGLLSFALVNSAGTSESFAFGVKYKNMFDSATQGPLAAGAKVTGELGYEVKKGDKNLTLKFTPNILSSGQTINVKIDK